MTVVALLTDFGLRDTFVAELKDVPRGETKDGVRSENLEALSFPDQSLDRSHK